MDEATRSPHSRIRACKNCSRRKKRCNGRKPQCSLCEQSGTACAYPQFSLKPGPKKGSKNVRRDTVISKVSRRLSGSQALLDNTNVNKCMNFTSAQPPTTHRCRSDDPSPRRSPTYDEGDGSHDTDDYEEKQSVGSGHLSIGRELEYYENSRSNVTLPQQWLLNHLVGIFFDYVHPQVRLLHRPTFPNWVETAEFRSDKDAGFLLSTMAALAARYSDEPKVDLFDRMLLRKSENGVENTDPDGSIPKRRHRGSGFLNQARRIFRSELLVMEDLELQGKSHRPSMTFMRAAALLSFADLARKSDTTSYCTVSQSVRLAYDCSLHEIDRWHHTKLHSSPSTDLDYKNTFVEKEGLRRIWWAIADIGDIVCNLQPRPRLIDWTKCKTRLPCDDVDWFEGRECSSSFLPPSIYDLRLLSHLPLKTSISACRTFAMHLISFTTRVIQYDDAHNTHSDELCIIRECLIDWRQRFSTEAQPELRRVLNPDYALSDIIHSRILLEVAMIAICNLHIFNHATPARIFRYCEDLARERAIPGASDVNKSPESEAFAEALRAADNICTIVREWPTDSIIRTPPFVAGALWAAAILQLLVRRFSGADVGLVEKASFSLRILTMTMEKLAEYWGMSHFYFSCFRRFEQEPMERHDENFSREGDPGRCLSFPQYFNASFLSRLAAITHLDEEAGTHETAALQQSANDIESLHDPNTYSGFNLTDFGPFGNPAYMDVDLLNPANTDALDHLMPRSIDNFPYLSLFQPSNTVASHDYERYNLYGS